MEELESLSWARVTWSCAGSYHELAQGTGRGGGLGWGEAGIAGVASWNGPQNPNCIMETEEECRYLARIPPTNSTLKEEVEELKTFSSSI